MKKNILLLLSLCLLLFSCSEEVVPSITLNQIEFTVSDAAASKSISFESNMNWTAKSSESWCTVSPASGNPSTKSIIATLSANTTYDARSCIVTISVEGLNKTFTIIQNANLGLFVSSDKFQLGNDTATIEVEVTSNFEYDIIISDDWITKANTRSLSSTKHQFAIAKNESYDNREGSITINQKDGTITLIIKVYQSQIDAIILSNKTRDLSSESHALEFELKTNVDFEVIIPEADKSWVSYTGTRALRTETLSLNIAKNETYDARTTEIYVKDKFTALQDTITINQSQKDAIILSNKIRDISSDSRVLDVELKTNIDFEVIISEADKSWITYTGTRALRSETLLLNIAENKGNTVRSSVIYVKNKETSLQDTLTINQFEQFVYYVRKMGTLSATLNQTQKDTIRTMIVTGEINESDFEVMKWYMPKLRNIDLKDVKCDGDKIADEAFGGHQRPNRDITKIILPLSITTIGSKAFMECSGLTGYLVLPNGLVEIEKSAFMGCTGLTGSLTLPDGLITIGNSAFTFCTGLTGSLILPDGLNTIEDWAFAHCKGLTGSLSLHNGLTSIGGYAFYNCTGFTGTLTLPDKLTTIGSNMFEYCSGFTGSLTLPVGLTAIGDRSFSGCSGFTGSLNLPDKLTAIGSAAFMDCSGFTGLLTLPDALTTIGDFGFERCNNVAAFRFPHTAPLPHYNNMLPATATVQVPSSAVATYKATDGWKDYNIVGY